MGAKAEELRFKVQDEIVKVITERVEHGEMTQERAKKIAQLILDKLPEEISYEKLIKVIPTLDDHFQELSTVVVPIMTEYEEKMKKVVNAKVASLMKDGKFDAVLDVTNKAIEYEKGLS